MARKNQKHRKIERREEAEVRQKQYAELTDSEKLVHAGKKERAKINNRQGVNNAE